MLLYQVKNPNISHLAALNIPITPKDNERKCTKHARQSEFVLPKIAFPSLLKGRCSSVFLEVRSCRVFWHAI
jgi:hypothetical protein